MVQLFVKSLDNKTRLFDFPAATPVSELRKQLAESERVPFEDLRIFSSVSDLADEANVGEVDSPFLFASLRLKGGAKKKRKKSFTKPKKIKHKKKKVPLAVLKYYKVSDDGKVTRLRRSCPNPTCGPGVFMAAHRGRQYCGKCGLTYVSEGK
ncbi:hypothetical protein GpartN1_g6299.t1 [Galdieria partita]|uniref:Ubiquitin-like domain-containing protein n=1 Tax=Galdieria partita TaxID=83374 RepID=A0A9C7Q110_9RHOD|nr:hypothetical protein GpartN1_g1678.t1 [Galdieria partita]GJQ14508.1 hypothetical protein GpartN1_g6299.t1 [Galdieria partita]